MIAHTVAQAAARLFTSVATIEEWITAGHLHAIRNPVDGHRYIDGDHLLTVDRDVRRGLTPEPRPEPLPVAALAQWLTDRGRPTTGRAVRDWIEDGRITPTTRARPGPGGWTACYDPLDALAVARTLDTRRTP